MVGFRTAYNDPIRSAVYNPQEGILIRLKGRSETPISLDVGHSPIDHQVVALNVVEVAAETLVVTAAVGAVHLEGHTVQSV